MLDLSLEKLLGAGEKVAIVDLETMGLTSAAPICTIGVTLIDTKSGKILPECFYVRVDWMTVHDGRTYEHRLVEPGQTFEQNLEEVRKHLKGSADFSSTKIASFIEANRQAGIRLDQATLDWWANDTKKLTDEARKEIFGHRDHTMTLYGALLELAAWLKDQQVTGILGFGANFDNAIVEYHWALRGIKSPVPYKRSLCARSFLTLFTSQLEDDRGLWLGSVAAAGLSMQGEMPGLYAPGSKEGSTPTAHAALYDSRWEAEFLVRAHHEFVTAIYKEIPDANPPG